MRFNLPKESQKLVVRFLALDSFKCLFPQIPEGRLERKGHAVDVVEAENRPFYKPKGERLTAAEQREKELLETEAFDNLNISDDEEEDDEQSSGNVTYRVSEGRTGTVPVISSKEQQGLPRWDSRWPIDVWVSCGEPFVPLEGMCGLAALLLIGTNLNIVQIPRVTKEIRYC